jgi:hypothetical protein
MKTALITIGLAVLALFTALGIWAAAMIVKGAVKAFRSEKSH